MKGPSIAEHRSYGVRYLAVGDIHGCFEALRTLAAAVPFTDDDTIITLGDYVDRGPNSCAVLDWLIAHSKRGKLVALRGNHEIMMLRARDSKDLLQDSLGRGRNPGRLSPTASRATT